jgi:predicted nuclease with TOPRIM domain
MFAGDEFFLIKMPLESVEISRVNVDGDNINLTAADVDSFDVAAVERRRERVAEMCGKKMERKR